MASIEGAGLANLATASAAGRPHVSVISPAVEGDGLWFATTLSSKKARNLAENPRVALMWRPQAEVYLTGAAALVTDEVEKGRLWESGLFAFNLAAFWGSPANPELVFVQVAPESAAVLTMGADGLARRRWRRAAH